MLKICRGWVFLTEHEAQIMHVSDASALGDVRREGNRQGHGREIQNWQDPSGKRSDRSEDCLQEKKETL